MCILAIHGLFCQEADNNDRATLSNEFVVAERHIDIAGGRAHGGMTRWWIIDFISVLQPDWREYGSLETHIV